MTLSNAITIITLIITLISVIYHWPWPCRRIPRCVWWCSPGWPTPDSGSQDSGTSGSFLVPRKCWRCRSKCDLCRPARSLGADFSTIEIIQICLYLLIVHIHVLIFNGIFKEFWHRWNIKWNDSVNFFFLFKDKIWSILLVWKIQTFKRFTETAVCSQVI